MTSQPAGTTAYAAVRQPDTHRLRTRQVLLVIAVPIGTLAAAGGAYSGATLPILIAATLDRNYHVRQAAVTVLTGFRHPSTGDALIASLLDEDPLVRARAALGQDHVRTGRVDFSTYSMCQHR